MRKQNEPTVNAAMDIIPKVYRVLKGLKFGFNLCRM